MNKRMNTRFLRRRAHQRNLAGRKNPLIHVEWVDFDEVQAELIKISETIQHLFLNLVEEKKRFDVGKLKDCWMSNAFCHRCRARVTVYVFENAACVVCPMCQNIEVRKTKDRVLKPVEMLHTGNEETQTISHPKPDEEEGDDEYLGEDPEPPEEEPEQPPVEGAEEEGR